MAIKHFLKKKGVFFGFFLFKNVFFEVQKFKKAVFFGSKTDFRDKKVFFCSWFLLFFSLFLLIYI